MPENSMIGKRVQILPNHLHEGKTGVVTAVMDTVIGRMYRIKLDDSDWPDTGVKPELLREVL